MAQKSASISKIVFVSLALVTLSACDLSAIWAYISGAQPATQPSPQVSSSPSPGATPEFMSPAAQASKANSELLHEVYLVVLMQEPADRSAFGGLVDVLNQGASFEGVYNGFT